MMTLFKPRYLTGIRVFGRFSLLIFLLALWLPGPCSGASSGAEDEDAVVYDIPAMIQLNPNFSTYPDSDGIIWLKQINYGIADEGGIERTSRWIILGRKGLDQRWLSWNLPVPETGSLEITEASVYSSATGAKIGDVTPSDSAPQTRAVAFSGFTGLPDEFILSLSYKEIFPEKLFVDGLVWLSEPLPLWEGEVKVTVPSGHSFYHSSNTDEEPEEENADDRQVYTWRVINAAADESVSIRAAERLYAAFGAREGREAMALILKGMEENLPSAEIPANKIKKEKRASEQGIENILKWFYSQPGIELPETAWDSRGPSLMRGDAPWTSREKTLLAYRALKDAGAEVRLFWLTAYRPGGDEPACAAAAVAPVMAISASPQSKNEVFYCGMDQAPRFGESSTSLSGRVLYGVTPEGRLEERKVPGKSASENRLNVSFKLGLDENGVMTGTFSVKARGAWRTFLFPGNFTESGPEFLLNTLFSQAPRCTGLNFAESKNESELSGTLAPIQSILGTGGGNILASVPQLTPRWLASLSGAPLPYSLRFPFILDTHFTLALPKSTSNVPLPAAVERGGGKIRYTDSFKLGKNKVLTADSRLNAGTESITDENVADFGMALQSLQNFTLRPLAVQLRK